MLSSNKEFSKTLSRTERPTFIQNNWIPELNKLIRNSRKARIIFDPLSTFQALYNNFKENQHFKSFWTESESNFSNRWSQNIAGSQTQKQ